MMKNWKITGLVAAVIIVITIPLYIFLQLYSNSSKNESNAATFVGKTGCIDCHKKEYNSWQQSDHKRAMEIATDSSVVGDFNNTKFISSKGNETIF
ncbi:MAG: hypothetical protein KAI45_02340, partial [Melioribacteraceae bacterium]|nr:hypothetical protein [Melioribacteraceae bacterium]